LREHALIALAGLALGGVSVTLLHGARSDREQTVANAEHASPSDDARQLEGLSRRLSALEREQAQRADSADDTTQVQESRPSEAPEAFDSERARASLESELDEFSERLAEHAAGAPDRSFAEAARRAYTDDLSGLATRVGFELGAVDCRANSCTAVTRWPSLRAAMQGYPALLHHPYRRNCAVETVLQDEVQPGQAYEATFLYTCDAS
jgi:hypothetical protein